MKERGKAKGRMNRDTSLSKKIIFQAGLKLCETKFSGVYIHLAHLLTSKTKIKKTKELSWSENRLQGAEVPGTEDGRLRNNVTWHYQAVESHTAPWRKGVPGNDATWRDTRQKPLTK